jgi:hypothetical protein
MTWLQSLCIVLLVPYKKIVSWLGCSSVVEYLTSVCKALSSKNPKFQVGPYSLEKMIFFFFTKSA